MTLLVLDLGNTRVKFAVVEAGELVRREALGWAADTAGTLAALFADMPPVSRVVGASVVDAARESLVDDVVRARFDHAVEWLHTPAEACGVRNAYAEPQRLGIDRFLAMVEAYAADRAPCVLASVGTALTLDALDADGRHLGGLIAPGPLLMQQSVLGATVRVRAERPGQVLDLADNTADALASGCWQAAAALVDRFVARNAASLGGKPALTLGGGDAPMLAPLLAQDAVLVPDAVLRGLAVWAGQYPQAP